VNRPVLAGDFTLELKLSSIHSLESQISISGSLRFTLGVPDGDLQFTLRH